MFKYSIYAASGLVKVLDSQTIPVRLLNPNPKPVTDYKNSTLGYLHLTAETLYTYDLASEDASTNPLDSTGHSPPNKNNVETVEPDLSSTTITPEQETKTVTLLNQYRNVFRF